MLFSHILKKHWAKYTTSHSQPWSHCVLIHTTRISNCWLERNCTWTVMNASYWVCRPPMQSRSSWQLYYLPPPALATADRASRANTATTALQSPAILTLSRRCDNIERLAFYALLCARVSPAEIMRAQKLVGVWNARTCGCAYRLWHKARPGNEATVSSGNRWCRYYSAF